MRRDYFNSLDNFLDYTEGRRRQWYFFIDVVTFVIVGIAAYWFINVPAMKVRAAYVLWHQSNRVATSVDENQNVNTDIAQLQSSDNKPPVTTDLSEGLHIDKINVSAPITWNADSNSINGALEKGVVHIAGTAMPGTPGNMFLTGHSSDYWWMPGDYKTVFALLDKMESGDEIQIAYNKNLYLYRVYNKQVISKDEVSNYVETDKPESVTLMTCYPVGTNWKRLIVQAERKF